MYVDHYWIHPHAAPTKPAELTKPTAATKPAHTCRPLPFINVLPPLPETKLYMKILAAYTCTLAP